MSEVPPYIGTAEVGKACRMTTRRARRMLARVGVLERHGTLWVVSDSRLREVLPDVYQRVFEWYVFGQNESQARPAETSGDQFSAPQRG